MFRFKSGDIFEAVQADRDQVVQLPHLQVLVPAGDWVLHEVGADGAPLRPMLHLTNATFRELVEPADSDGSLKLGQAIPVYIPEPSPPNPDQPPGA